MPPWKPEPGYGEFEGSRRLTDAEIDVFRRWLADGLREGDRADLPPAPEFPRGWELGEPDLVLTMPAYTLRAGGPDMFRNFVVPVASGQMRYVRAWEFHPGNARVVHHATLQIDASGASRRYDEQDKESGYEGLIAPSARAPDGFFLDWAPGHRPNVAPDGIAWSLPPSSDLVMMLHLRPSGKEEQVQASIGLYFAKDTPTRIPTMLRLTKQDLDFPANVQAQRVTDSFTVPTDVDLLTVQPHAHYLARDLRGFARLPDGSLRPLIHIADWDFDWQDVYRFATPVFLPAGSTLVMEYSYDNSAANPRNPNTPPRRVTYGQQTSDEMAELWFQAVPRDPRARATLNRRVYEKILPAEIDGRRMMLAHDPQNVALHDDLALLYSDANQPRAAVDEFKASLALRPASAAARYNVGAALLAAGDRLAAREYLEAALQADANHARAHSSLAVILDAAGDHAAARTHHAQALRLEPGNADIQLSAGVGFAMAGDRAQAVDHLVEAIRLQPDWPNAMAALASVMTDDPQATVAEPAHGGGARGARRGALGPRQPGICGNSGRGAHRARAGQPVESLVPLPVVGYCPPAGPGQKWHNIHDSLSTSFARDPGRRPSGHGRRVVRAAAGRPVEYASAGGARQRQRVAVLRRRPGEHEIPAARPDQRRQLRQAGTGLALPHRQPRPASGTAPRGDAADGQRRPLYVRRQPAVGRRDRRGHRRAALGAPRGRRRARRLGAASMVRPRRVVLDRRPRGTDSLHHGGLPPGRARRQDRQPDRLLRQERRRRSEARGRSDDRLDEGRDRHSIGAGHREGRRADRRVVPRRHDAALPEGLQGLRPRLRRAHREAAVDLPHDSAEG